MSTHAAPTKHTMYLWDNGSWFMVAGEPTPVEKREKAVFRGVSAEKVVYVLCATKTPKSAIARALSTIPLAVKVRLK